MKRAEKVTAMGLFLLAFGGIVGLLASPDIYRIALANERYRLALEQIERASALVSREDDLRQRLDQAEAELGTLPGFSKIKSSVLFAAEATQLGADIFVRNGARVVSSQVLDAADAADPGGVRIRLVGEAGHNNLYEIIYDLEFGDAAFLIEEAVIRSARSGASSRGRRQIPDGGRSAQQLSVEVLIRWFSARQERKTP